MGKEVVQTPKLLIGGKFVRSESGKTYPFKKWNVPLSTKKDVRDAVQSATKAKERWQKTSPYLKGQILYRFAEMLAELKLPISKREKDNCENLIVHFAGWTDKWQAILSSVNPVATPMHNYTVYEPVGAVAAAVPETYSVYNLLLATLPPLASGCVVVAVLPENEPIPGIFLSQAFQTCDLPPGVINLLTGREKDILPHLLEHTGVDAIDLSGAKSPTEWRSLALDNLKRIYQWEPISNKSRTKQWDPLQRILAYTEAKTVWHPIGW